MIQEVWQQYRAALQKASPLGAAALRSGASERHLREAEQALGFALPEEVAAFYAAHDGADPVDEECAVAFTVCYFIPLLGAVDSAVAEAATWDPDDVELPDADYARTLLPFAKDFGGNALLVQCRTSDASVWRWDPGNGVPLLRIAANLADFLHKERRYLELGLDADHLLNHDDDYRYLDP